MLFAADYPFLDVFWTMLVFFGWVIWFWLLITVFADLFRRHDISGWGKAGWTRVRDRAAVPRRARLPDRPGHSTWPSARWRTPQASRAAFDDYVRDGRPATPEPSDQIAKAKQLLDSGAIDAAEFEQLKRKALA